MEQLQTGDIFRSASLLCLGARLHSVSRQGREVLFTLAAPALSRLDLTYRTGKAKVNPLQLRETLNLLRDVIFGRTELPRGGQG